MNLAEEQDDGFLGYAQDSLGHLTRKRKRRGGHVGLIITLDKQFQLESGTMTTVAFQLDMIDAIDPQLLHLTAHVPPEQRALAMMETTEWVLAGLRGAMHKSHPEWSQRELNLRVLAYVTPLRGVTVEELLRRWG